MGRGQWVDGVSGSMGSAVRFTFATNATSSKVNREWFISCRAKARRVCLFMCSRLDLETSSVGATKVTRGHCNPLHPPRLKKNHVFLFLEASNSASASLAFFKEDFGSQVALSNG